MEHKTLFEIEAANGAKIYICKHCGVHIVKGFGKLFWDNTLIFPQYCRNIEDKEGNVLKYGDLHEPIKS